jgi:DNA-binding XRE family transcriptional regulator
VRGGIFSITKLNINPLYRNYKFIFIAINCFKFTLSLLLFCNKIACIMSLGKTIKQIREQKGMLQKQVAAELNIGTTNYNKLENGNREPSVKELQQLAT